jgi:hypothetical protein
MKRAIAWFCLTSILVITIHVSLNLNKVLIDSPTTDGMTKVIIEESGNKAGDFQVLKDVAFKFRAIDFAFVVFIAVSTAAVTIVTKKQAAKNLER